MDQRGRKSSANLAVVRPSLPMQRLQAPARLTADQAEIYCSVIGSKPGDWFTNADLPLLEGYTRAVVEARRVATLIDGFDTECLKESEHRQAYDQLLKMAAGLDDRARKLATSLRLTQQSRYTPQAAATASRKAGGQRPWMREGETVDG